MKVVIVTQGIPEEKAPLNGIFAWDQALALKKEGVEVACVALDFRRVWDRKMGKDYFTREGIPVFRYSLPTGIYRRALPMLQFIWLQVLDDLMVEWGKPDVVHAHFYFMGAIVASTTAKRGIPVVLTEHSSKLNKPLYEISHLDQRLVRKAYAGAQAHLAVSSSFADLLSRQFKTSFQVVPNVIDFSNFPYEEKPVHTPFQFISVGLLIDRKGMMELIHSFKEAGFTPEECQLKIVGEGPMHALLEEEILKMGLEHQVELLGMVPRPVLAHYVSQSDAFVLLSKNETFGVSYVEAMGMGLPVIATNCGGPADFITPENGVLLEGCKIDKVAQAMRTMYENHSQYQAAQIAAWVREKYSARALAENLKKIYVHVCSLS